MKRGQLRAIISLSLSTFILTMSMTVATHFKGGTISWKSKGGTTVQFLFKLGWTYGHSPACPGMSSNSFGTDEDNSWKCTHGCPPNTILKNVCYNRTAANIKEDWEQGQGSFMYTFTGRGPFIVSYNWNAWITLSNNKGGADWQVATEVDLRERNDTGRANSSPESLCKPINRVQFGCLINLRIPSVDPDGDHIRCRWGNGDSECGSVCNALPDAVLDEETCTLTFNTTQDSGYIENGIYAVALIIEDYPRSSITMGAGRVKKTPSDALSSIPLQFLVKVMPPKGGIVACSSIPRFVDPTPAEKEVIMAKEGQSINITVYADNNKDNTVKAEDIRVSGPISARQSSVTPDVNRLNTFQTTLTWRPTHSDEGDHIVCASVTNADGINGKQRCFTIRVEIITTIATTTTTIPTTPTSTTTTTTTSISTTTTSRALTTSTSTLRPTTTTTAITTTKTTTTTAVRAAATTNFVRTTTMDPSTTTPRKSATTSDRSTTTSPISTTTSPQSTTKEDEHTTPKVTHFPTTSSPMTAMLNKDYETCRCIIRETVRPHGVNEEWTTESSDRDVLTFVFGIPIGLALSVFTSAMYKRCRQNTRGKNNKWHRQPRQRPRHLSTVSPVSW